MAQVAERTSRLQSLLSKRAADLPSKPRLDATQAANQISFTYGFPDPASLPADQVAEATVRALKERGHEALQYGDAKGYSGLIDELTKKLNRDQGLNAGRENVLLTAGGSQALALVLDALVDWGDTVITEEPTWMGAVRAFKNVGAQPVAVPVDDEGMNTDALERELKRLKAEGIQPKLIYIIVNFQNPSGVTTSLERRKRIVALAQEYGTMILEDDAYFDLRYGGDFLPPLYALDDSGSVLYLGTFSKIMGAGMRIGWLVGPPELIMKLAILKIDGGTNVFGAHVAAEWMPEHLDSHIEKLRAIYHRRRDLMIDALATHMPEGVTWTTPDGGFFIWVTLPDSIDTERLATQSKERGVAILPGAQCFVSDQGTNTMRLSYSYASDDQIEPGIKILADVVKGDLLETAGR